MSGSKPPSPVNCTPSNWACSTRRATSAFNPSGNGDPDGTASAFTITGALNFPGAHAPYRRTRLHKPSDTPIRGEVEQLIARSHVIAHAAVRTDLAEDLTARTLAACAP